MNMAAWPEQQPPPDIPVEVASSPERGSFMRRAGRIASIAVAATVFMTSYSGESRKVNVDQVGLTAIDVAGTLGEVTISTLPIVEVEPLATDKGLSDPVKKKRAEKITASFEGPSLELGYDDVANIHDGRGITAGRDGFTSGTGDLLMVYNRYQTQTTNTHNVLVKYGPALRAIEKQRIANNYEPVGSTKGLKGFGPAWQYTSRHDPALNKAQDYVDEILYFNPAMKDAKEVGIKTSLGQEIILDTAKQHGRGPDEDGLPEIIDETKDAMGGKVKSNEVKWLKKFLAKRKYHLLNAVDPATRQPWRYSVDRVNALSRILDTGNTALNLPIKWTVYGDSFSINK